MQCILGVSDMYPSSRDVAFFDQIHCCHRLFVPEKLSEVGFAEERSSSSW